jgi:hypothetical protein
VLLLPAKTSRRHPPSYPEHSERSLHPPRALAHRAAMWSRIIRFEILFVAAGTLLVVGIAYFF